MRFPARASATAAALVLCCGAGGLAAGSYETIPLQPQKPQRIAGRKDQAIQGWRVTAAAQGDGDKDEHLLRIDRCENLVLLACEIGPGRKALRVANSRNVKILNCWIHDAPGAPGVVFENCEDVLVQGCRIERVETGVYALTSKTVKVVGNYVEDVLGPMPRGQLSQFDKVSGPGTCVIGNYGINFAGQSRPEDMISIYMSQGTPESPILIEENYLVGDPVRGSTGKSQSGSGIMLGDAGGAHLRARKNTLVNSGQVGIGVCGGSDIVVEENAIYGWPCDVANVGIYTWNQSQKPGADIRIRKNVVVWFKGNGTRSSFWDGKGFDDVTIEDNQWDALEHFERSFPQPPSFEPLPPRPHDIQGKVVLPWKVTERELADEMAARDKWELTMKAARKVLGRGTANDADFAKKRQSELQTVLQGIVLILQQHPETRSARYARALAEELALALPKIEPRKPSGNDASNGKGRSNAASSASPASARRIRPEALARWDARLQERVREELAAQRAPKFTLASLKETVEIRTLDGKGQMRIVSPSLDLPFAWSRLTPADRKDLALALVRKDEPADHALAAFFLLLLGDEERAAKHLVAAGSAADEVRNEFE